MVTRFIWSIILCMTIIYNGVSAQTAMPGSANLNSAIDHTNKKEHMEALIACTYAIKSDSSNADAYYLRAFNFFKLDNKSAALSDVNRSISINKNNSDAYILRGKIFKSMGKYIAAYQDFKHANNLNPTETLLFVTKSMFSTILPSSGKAK